MNSIREYLISIVSVCMICVLAQQLLRREKMQKIIRFVGGVLILLTVVSPLLSFDADSLEDLWEKMSLQMDVTVEDLEESSKEALARHVKQTAENYIEEKARTLGATLQAEVVLSDEEYPTPFAVTLIGTVTSGQMQELTRYLSQDLGIAAERQEWKLYGETD